VAPARFRHVRTRADSELVAGDSGERAAERVTRCVAALRDRGTGSVCALGDEAAVVVVVAGSAFAVFAGSDRVVLLPVLACAVCVPLVASVLVVVDAVWAASVVDGSVTA
jgi:hypothetical protein